MSLLIIIFFYLTSRPLGVKPEETKNTVLSQEETVVNIAKNVSPSIVTVGSGNEFPDMETASGFIVSTSGLIITNKHVVTDDEAKYFVMTSDLKKYPVNKIYRDQLHDLAALQIEPPAGLKPVILGDSNNIKVGQLAIAIGTALGEFPNTVTVGVISAVRSPFIQTSAAVNSGNSGGALLNSRGSVVGVTTAAVADSQNINFAIPANTVRNFLQRMSLVI